MSGDTLTVRSPGDRVIAEFLCEYESIADRAVQLQTTGEQTAELHEFVMGIINDQVEVQDGISIEALRGMALTVGDGLGPLGEYFLDLAAATHVYADACRIAGDLTKFMPERVTNLQASLAALVEERESAEGLLADANSLGEDDQAAGYLIPYSVLLEEGTLNMPSTAVILDGMPKDQAVRTIESRLEALATLHQSVHDRNDGMLVDFDTAVSAWEEDADDFINALDGILGVLKDTKAENDYQKLGTVSDAAGAVGTAGDVMTIIPVPLVSGVGMTLSLLASMVSTAAETGQWAKVQFQPGEGSVRVVEGQVAGEGGEAIVAASGFIPVTDLAKNVIPISERQEIVIDAIETASGAPTPDTDEGRGADLAVDVGVDSSPINQWQQEADATNPNTPYTPGAPMPTAAEREASQPPAPERPVEQAEPAPKLQAPEPYRPTLDDLPPVPDEPAAAPAAEPAPAPDSDVEPLEYNPPERPTVADLPSEPQPEREPVRSFEEIMEDHADA